MAKRIIKIKTGCCGDCPFYNFKKHKCTKGAKEEGEAQDHFYLDCPLDWEEEQKEKDNNGWIACSERLPEKYGDYLCCDNYGNYIIGYPTKRVAYDEYYVETECEIMEDCIAWQPLPKAYREVEE